VAALCATWWILEALPMPATSMVPLVVFPVAGVLSEREVAAAYGDPIVLLFMGAFMVSKAVERWGAHRRIAQAMMAGIGSTSGPRVVLAIMLATTLCSFWINNTSIALMMLPVALAVVEQDKSGKLAVPLLLGVAYSASIGGIATPIGTAPNGVFQSNYRKLTGETVPFHHWILLGGLVAMLMMVAAWAVLSWRLRGVSSIKIETSGKWTAPQKRTLAIFGLAALAWMTREVPYGGWSGWLSPLIGSSESGDMTVALAAALESFLMLPYGNWSEWLSPRIGGSEAGDMTVAVAAALAMFLLPSGERKGERLLDWETAVSIPWGVLVLFGGGIALAAAFESSGLSTVMGEKVTGLSAWPLLATIGALCLATTFFSEVTSNTATANLLMPILGSAAVANGMEPALLMFPATLANSLAFMMPVGTPPNAIVYASGQLRIIDMVRYGFVLNLIGAVIVTLACWWMMPVIFGGYSAP
jgi:sodium-dependent dicarboxylate transporter 2/3/5